MNCKFCKGKCQKAGRQSNGRQRLYCSVCKKYQQSDYCYMARSTDLKDMIANLVCEGVSVRGIARILKIAINTVLSYIRKIASRIIKPPIVTGQSILEVDELRTFIRNKKNEYWVAYALNRANGKVIDYVVGKRTKRTLRILINTLLISGVKKIRTDNLSAYRGLIPKSIHEPGAYKVNHIERRNLDLRTHLKRLSRRTICFSRTASMLNACLRIYFWKGLHSSKPVPSFNKK